MQKVMVFGVFDGVHEGHRAFLRSAKIHGDYLVIALAPDHIVHALKGHLPKRTFDERMEELLRESLADKVVSGDDALGVYEVITLHRPRVIALGYDQESLKNDILNHQSEFNWEWEIKMMDPHEPERLHSRLLNRG